MGYDTLPITARRHKPQDHNLNRASVLPFNAEVNTPYQLEMFERSNSPKRRSLNLYETETICYP
jgi:hypothetical protein